MPGDLGSAPPEPSVESWSVTCTWGDRVAGERDIQEDQRLGNVSVSTSQAGKPYDSWVLGQQHTQKVKEIVTSGAAPRNVQGGPWGRRRMTPEGNAGSAARTEAQTAANGTVRTFLEGC